MHLVVIGGTSAIAIEVVQYAIEQGQVTRVTLIGRNDSKVNDVRADLEIRHDDIRFSALSIDFSDGEELNSKLCDLAETHPIDLALVAHGVLPAPHRVASPSDISATVHVNATTHLICLDALTTLMSDRGGRIAVITSVAGVIGRQSNYLYGATKSIVSTYVQGLQHRFYQTSMSITDIRPGPVETPMLDNLAERPRNAACPKQVAKEIYKGMMSGRRVLYTPGRWRLIMTVLKCLPWPLYGKLRI